MTELSDNETIYYSVQFNHLISIAARIRGQRHFSVCLSHYLYVCYIIHSFIRSSYIYVCVRLSVCVG